MAVANKMTGATPKPAPKVEAAKAAPKVGAREVVQKIRTHRVTRAVASTQGTVSVRKVAPTSIRTIFAMVTAAAIFGLFILHPGGLTGALSWILDAFTGIAHIV
jgi:hypothetical protein